MTALPHPCAGQGAGPGQAREGCYSRTLTGDATQTEGFCGLSSPPILNLDYVAIWVGDVGVQERTRVVAARHQPATKVRRRGYDCVKVLTAHQHDAKMAYAPLHPGQPLLPRYLSGTATGVPSRALRIESQQVSSAWRLEKNEISVFRSNVLHAKETRVE